MVFRLFAHGFLLVFPSNYASISHRLVTVQKGGRQKDNLIAIVQRLLR